MIPVHYFVKKLKQNLLTAVKHLFLKHSELMDNADSKLHEIFQLNQNRYDHRFVLRKLQNLIIQYYYFYRFHRYRTFVNCTPLVQIIRITTNDFFQHGVHVYNIS